MHWSGFLVISKAIKLEGNKMINGVKGSMFAPSQSVDMRFYTATHKGIFSFHVFVFMKVEWYKWLPPSSVSALRKRGRSFKTLRDGF